MLPHLSFKNNQLQLKQKRNLVSIFCHKMQLKNQKCTIHFLAHTPNACGKGNPVIKRDIHIQNASCNVGAVRSKIFVQRIGAQLRSHNQASPGLPRYIRKPTMRIDETPNFISTTNAQKLKEVHFL